MAYGCFFINSEALLKFLREISAIWGYYYFALWLINSRMPALRALGCTAFQQKALLTGRATVPGAGVTC